MNRTDLRRILRVLVGLLPLWILVVLMAVPASRDAIGANPPSLAGLPLGIVLVSAALFLMVVGIETMRRAPSQQYAFLAFAGLTLPSAMVMVVGPLFVLLIQTRPVA